MVTGTSWFPSMWCARRYYGYEHNADKAPREAIERKVAKGLVHIGQPPFDPAKQKLVALDGGLRWGLEDLA
jgi:hypothetical protein